MRRLTVQQDAMLLRVLLLVLPLVLLASDCQAQDTDREETRKAQMQPLQSARLAA